MTKHAYFWSFFALLSLFLCNNIQTLQACEAEELPESHVSFVENKGQWHENVQYQIEMNMARLFLENNRMTYLLMSPSDIEAIHEAHHNRNISLSDLTLNYHVFRTNFVNANENVETNSSCMMDNYRNYFIGNDPNKWAGHVGLFRQIDYYNLYEGIDLKYYGTGGSIKYDLLVSPNADASQIVLEYEGANAVSLENGKLHIATSVNTVIENSPYAYQYIDGQLQEVACEYILEENQVRFSFPNGYDTTKELIIDPEIVFATYTGATTDNWGFTATYDEAGHLYAGGASFGVGYPTTVGAFQENFAGGDLMGPFQTDIGITKFTPDGSNLIYSTYLGGGDSNEMPHSMFVSDDNELVVLGSTGSNTYPTTADAFDTSFNGGNPFSGANNIQYTNGADIVVARFSADGSDLVASTYLGGSGDDGLNLANELTFNYADEARGEVFLDNAGNVYICSSTNSIDFPTSIDAFQPFSTGGFGSQNGIVVKFNPNLSEMVWSSYIGGSDNNAVFSLKLDNEENLYISGGTSSTDFPTTSGAINETYQGGAADAFVAKINNDGTQLLASTLLGTNAYDQAFFVDFDLDGFIYTVGQTSGDYAVEGNVYSNNNSGQFIHKMSNDLTTTEWATVVGTGNGTPDIAPSAFSVDNCYRIFVSGWGGNVNGGGGATGSTTQGLPITADAFQSTTDGSDFYFLVLEQQATDILYATYFGSPSGTGEHVDGGTSRFSKEGVIYQAVCAGCGKSDQFPTTAGAWSNTNNSTNCNLGAIKFDFQTAATVADFLLPPSECVPYSVEMQNISTNAEEYQWTVTNSNGETVATTTETNPSFTFETADVYTITLLAIKEGTCNGEDVFSQNITASGIQEVEITDAFACINDGVFNLEASDSGGIWAGDGIVDAEAGTFDPNLVGLGTFEVSYTSTNAECEGTFFGTVTISDIPTFEILDLNCLNDGTDGFTAEIVVNGNDGETFNIDGDFSTTAMANTAFTATFASGGDGVSQFSLIIINNETTCADNLTFIAPECPECFPEAGTMPTDLQAVCSDGSVSATTTGEFLEPNQVLGYILHDSDSDSYGNILGQNTSGNFFFADLNDAEYMTEYYISAVVGFPDENGFPLLDDSCTDINAGTPILFISPLSYTIDEDCDWQTGDFTVVVQPEGGLPAYDNTATYNVIGDFAGELFFGETFTSTFAEGETTVYEYTISESCGEITIANDFYCEKTPIELLRFSGEAKEDGNALQWTTATENNNDFFSIERAKTANGHFEIIATIDGAGNSTTQKSYSFLDKNVNCGTYYYRLVQTDFDGSTSTSATINISRMATNGIQVSPIPANDNVTIEFATATNETTALRVFDAQGRLVYQEKIASNGECSQTQILDVSAWKSGIYMLQIANGEQMESTKLIKR